MSVIITDSAGVNIWLGDTVNTVAGSGTVTGLLSNLPLRASPNNVVVSIAGSQQTFLGSAVTVTSRASEQASTADQTNNGLVA